MKIVPKSKLNGVKNIIDVTLYNRNIPNLELFLNPENAEDSNPLEFYRMEEGIDLLLNHLNNGSTIVILVDADTDGYTSAAMLYKYLTNMNMNAEITYIVHETKAHGLTDNVMDEIEEIRPNLIICPDSSSNDVERIEKLEASGINVLVLDHHQVTNHTDKGVIINNQLCSKANKNFVGVGVVYKFLQALDIKLGTNNVENYVDLFAVGQVADISDISDPEIRKLVLKGLDNINNNFLKTVIQQEFGLFKVLSQKNLAFSVVPLINAVTRVGTLEEREILFEAMADIGSNRFFTVKKRKKDKTTGKFNNVELKFSIYEYAYDIAKQVKNRQDSIVKKMLPIVEENIIEDNGIIISFLPDEQYSGVSGLIANKLVSKYDKPVLLLVERENCYTGSGRGHEKTIKDFRQWCENSNVVEFAQGHDNAFGISINKEKLNDFKEYAKKLEKQEVVYEVDIICNKPSKEDCELVDRNIRLFGGNVSEPFVGIIGLRIPKKFINQSGSMLNIYSWGVKCVKFNSSPELFEQIENIPDDNIIVDMVGYYSFNEWGAKRTPQFIIKDIEIANNDIVEEINEDNIIF